MILGIDPGQTGAIVLIDDAKRALLQIWDMPTSEKTRGKGQQVNAYLLADVIDEAIDLAAGGTYGIRPEVVIEAVGAMPGQGVTSMFGFGHSAGVVDGVVAAKGLKATKVAPQAWKRLYGLTGREKDAARTEAMQLYPEASAFLARKKDCGRADALLIAHWGAVNG